MTVLLILASPMATLALSGPSADRAGRLRLLESACPAGRDPIPVGDPRLTNFWRAAAAFDRSRHGFSALPITGNVVFEHDPDTGAAVIHTCEFANRIYRTVHFRFDRNAVRWVGEQQSFRSGQTFENANTGTLQEEITLDYEIEPVAGFPLDRLNIHYRGPRADGAGRLATLSQEQARALLDEWGF